MRLINWKHVVTFITMLGLVTTFIVTVPSNANAVTTDRPSTLDEYLQQQLSSDKLDQAQQESLEKVVELRKITEQQVLESLMEATAEAAAASAGDVGTLDVSTDIPLGTDYTFFFASEGKDGGSATGFADYTTSYDLDNQRNLVGSWSSGAGQGSGWAWTGRRFTIDGSGSQTAYFSVNGYYAAMLSSFGQGSNAIMYLRLRLYDATEEQWVDEGTVALETEIDSSMTHSDNYSKNNLIQATLEGGHEYVILLQFEGVSTSIAGFLAEVESGRPDLSYYSDWTYIELNF